MYAEAPGQTPAAAYITPLYCAPSPYCDSPACGWLDAEPKDREPRFLCRSLADPWVLWVGVCIFIVYLMSGGMSGHVVGCVTVWYNSYYHQHRTGELLVQYFTLFR